MYYVKTNGVITAGPFNCEQSFPTEFIDESDPVAVGFNTPNAIKLDIAALEFEQLAKMTPRARREMDLGSILAFRAIGTVFQVLGAALNQPPITAAGTTLSQVGKVEDKANPGTWIDAPGTKALIDIQTAIAQKRAQL